MKMDQDDGSLEISQGADFPELRSAIQRICAEFPASYWQRMDAEEAYPEAFVKTLTENGYLAALIPEEYGGSGMPMRAAGVILEEINRSGAHGGACHAQMYTMGCLLRHGGEEQKQRYLPKIASGELRLQAFGISEPTSGSDTTKIKTKAVRDGDDYVINGQKIWTSRALYSDLMLLLVRTTPLSDVSRKTDGLSVFLVDMQEARKKEGLEIRPIKVMINHHTTELFFTDMRVPASNLVGEEGKGFKHILDGMNAERILIGHEAVGDCQWFLERAVTYAKERVVFDRPIGQNQGVQFPLAKAFVHYRAADLMLRKAAARFDQGLPCGDDANTAKLLATEAAWEAAEACMQTHGGFGLACEYDVERKWREARGLRIAPVSNDLVLAYVAQHMLGLPRSY